MFIPPYYREENTDRILSFIRAYPFGQIISSTEGLPFITHIPFLISENEGSFLLRGHMARSNPQWRHFDGRKEVTVVFQGPHAYISPSLYAAFLKAPTWNYMAVHVSGKPVITEGLENLLQLMEDSIRTFDEGFLHHWHQMPDEYKQGLLHGVAAFEIKAEKVEAAFKLSQDKPEEDRERIIAALSESDNSDVLAIAKYMQDY
jgi:transcriptional regulator